MQQLTFQYWNWFTWVVQRGGKLHSDPTRCNKESEGVTYWLWNMGHYAEGLCRETSTQQDGWYEYAFRNGGMCGLWNEALLMPLREAGTRNSIPSHHQSYGTASNCAGENPTCHRGCQRAYRAVLQRTMDKHQSQLKRIYPLNPRSSTGQENALPIWINCSVKPLRSLPLKICSANSSKCWHRATRKKSRNFLQEQSLWKMKSVPSRISYSMPIVFSLLWTDTLIFGNWRRKHEGVYWQNCGACTLRAVEEEKPYPRSWGVLQLRSKF